jgi:hypothetical protein
LEQAERWMREARQAGGRRSGFRRLVSRGCVAADRETGVEALFLEENISKDNTGEERRGPTRSPRAKHTN